MSYNDNDNSNTYGSGGGDSYVSHPSNPRP
jgi:hypothetical protein